MYKALIIRLKWHKKCFSSQKNYSKNKVFLKKRGTPIKRYFLE